MKIIITKFRRVARMKSWKLSINEIVLITTLGAMFGVIFWGWSWGFEIIKAPLKLIGFKYLLAGIWIMPGIFVSNIIQKPGAALYTSLMAAIVESMLSKWGPLSLLWGLVQGGLMEIVLLLFLYQNYRLAMRVSAIFLSTLGSYLVDFKIKQYQSLPIGFNLVQFFVYLISALFFAEYLGRKILLRLNKIGILSQFRIKLNHDTTNI